MSADRLHLDAGSHDRLEPIEFGSSWYPVCSCGAVGSACLTKREAWVRPCEVEALLSRSADVLKAIRAASDERRAVLSHV